MAKTTKNNSCGAPKLKELPAEFAKQVSISVDNANVISTILKASLPELAKLVAKGGGYYNTAHGVVKALNVATSLDLKASDITEEWGGYHGSGFKQDLSDAGLARSWSIKQDECGGYTKNLDTYDLYESTDLEVHLVFTRKLKDKKELARMGVK